MLRHSFRNAYGNRSAGIDVAAARRIRDIDIVGGQEAEQVTHLGLDGRRILIAHDRKPRAQPRRFGCGVPIEQDAAHLHDSEQQHKQEGRDQREFDGGGSRCPNRVFGSPPM